MTLVDVTVLDSAIAIHYLDTRTARVRFVNRTASPVIINEVFGYLRIPGGEVEESVQFEVRVQESLIQPSSDTAATLHIRAELALPLHTVPYDLRLYYQQEHASGWSDREGPLELARRGTIIVRRRDPMNKRIFISHKDPQDTEFARQLMLHLTNAGIESYIAEDDPRVGTPIWGEKLPNAIKSSNGLAVLWTQNAVDVPANITREIKMANEAKIPVFLCTAVSNPLPEGYDPGHEYAKFSYADPRKSLVNFAERIYSQLNR